MAGTEPLLQFRTTPDAIAAEFRLRSQRAGDRLLQGLQGNFPVWMLHGPDDLHTPPATLAERERQCPWVRFVRLEDGGVLLFYRHWARVLDLLTELTKK
jgi:pimeloyl-ACP methyl ester carboxylesterase